ncbi:MAG: flagellar hook-basal body protein [Acidobacteriota bacterium]
MDALTSVAAAGMRARLEALDLVANNLANAGTPGFKADWEAYSLYVGQESRESALSGAGFEQASAPVLERHRTDPRQGVLVESSNPGDLALSGEGYFLLESPEGMLLTRAGRIRVAADGRLVSPEGHEYVTVEPRPIRANPALPIDVDKDGQVWQEGARLGRLRTVEADLDATARREGLYFSLDKASLATLKAARAEVHQGKFEASNVSPAGAGVRLIQVLRQFEAMQKAVQLGGEMNRRAVEDVARVNA